MTILDTIKRLTTVETGYRQSYVPAIKQAGSYEVFGPMGQRNADWSLVADMPRVHDLYRKCATAYACTTLLADAVAESPLRLYQTIDGDPEERPYHKLRALLASPNPTMSEAEFMTLIVMGAGMWGYAVVEKVRSAGRLPVELWPLRPDWIKIERSGQDSIHVVYRRPNTDARLIEPDDLIVIPYRHDEQFSRPGITPLQVVAREIGIDVALTDLLKVFIDAGGIPPWAIKLTGDINPFSDQAEADAFRAKWSQRYGGSQAYGNLGILFPGMDLIKVGDSIGDMAWPDLRGLTEMKICQAFRVPAELVQARDAQSSGALTTTEMTGAMAFLQNHGAQPLRDRIDGAFTRGLMADFGLDSTWSLEFDTSGILALQEDEDSRHTRVREDWNAGLISMNEARALIDHIDLGTDGEVFKLAFTTMLVPIGEIGAPPPTPVTTPVLTAQTAQTSKSDRTYRDHKSMSPSDFEVRANILATQRRQRDKLEQIGTRALRKFFKAQGDRITSGLRFFPAIDVKALAIDWSEEEELLAEILKKFYEANGKAAFDTISGLAGVEIAWDLANPRIADIIDKLGLSIVDINETTRIDVVNKIAAGQAEGLSLPEIADTIRDMFEQTYKGRAATVARTETQASYNLASQLAYRDSGVVETVEMVDNPDHAEGYGASDGLTCADRDGMVIEVSQMDRHVYAEHPNGSLAFIPILSTPLGE